MFSSLLIIFKTFRTLGKTDTLKFFEEIYNPPILIKVFFKVIGFRFLKKKYSQFSPGERLTDALSKLGPAFIKLGQFLATRPDIVGEKFAKELQKLQDEMKPFDTEIAKKTLLNELGENKFKKISDFSSSIAAASIAQVHFAKITNDDGKKNIVAIKILRPNIEKIFHKELKALQLLAWTIESLIKKTRRLKLIEVMDLLKEMSTIEMDLRYEAAAASELRKNTLNDVGFKVPLVYWEFTNQRVLTIEKVEGVSIKDKDLLIKNNIDLKKISKLLIQNFLRQAVGDGYFHGDMHQGNLFVDKEENIVAVDFGIMGRLDEANRRYLAQILYGFIQRDYAKVAKVHFIAGLVPKDQSIENFTHALRTIGEPIFGLTAKNISAGKLLARLFEVTEKFNMTTQPQLLLLQKTMVVVEGVARSLDEDANIWEISKPILEGWLNKEIGPKNRFDKVIKTTSELIDKLPELPDMIDKMNKTMTLLNSINMMKFQNQDHENINKNSKNFMNKNYIIYGLILAIIILIVIR